MTDYLHKTEVPVGHVVYLVEDHPDGPRKTVWCERTERGFEGGLLGDVLSQLPIPGDDTRVEHFARAPGFRTTPKSWQYGSAMQSTVQPSPAPRLPSSHASTPAYTNPSPHDAGTHEPGHASSSLALPSSQVSTPAWM